jgi:hypothetical protein
MRVLVVALLLANLVFYAWTQGWLDSVAGVRASGDREPERLQRQVRPEVVRILTPQAVAAAASAAEAGLACLEAGPFDTASVGAAETALSSTLPSGTWTRSIIEPSGRWIVYMGRYANRDAMKRKEDELNRAKVNFEELSGAPELEPGIALGRFSDRDAADTALAQLAQRGIHTARVLQVARLSTQHMLRVERADAELAAKVQGLKLDALGRGFVPCARPS